jgi:hypothetical protein
MEKQFIINDFPMVVMKVRTKETIRGIYSGVGDRDGMTVSIVLALFIFITTILPNKVQLTEVNEMLTRSESGIRGGRRAPGTEVQTGRKPEGANTNDNLCLAYHEGENQCRVRYVGA